MEGGRGGGNRVQVVLFSFDQLWALAPCCAKRVQSYQGVLLTLLMIIVRR